MDEVLVAEYIERYDRSFDRNILNNPRRLEKYLAEFFKSGEFMVHPRTSAPILKMGESKFNVFRDIVKSSPVWYSEDEECVKLKNKLAVLFDKTENGMVHILPLE